MSAQTAREAAERLQRPARTIPRGAALPRTRRVDRDTYDDPTYDDADTEAPPRRRAVSAYEPAPRAAGTRGCVVDTLSGLALLVIGIYAGYLLVLRGYVAGPEMTAAPLPTPDMGQARGGATYAQPPVIERARYDAPGQAEPPRAEPTPTASDYGVASYNATQEAIAAGAPELAAPEPTALPAPGEAGFADSFQESTCSAMITYLRGHPCYGRADQAPQPQPGDEGFNESFR